MPANAPKPLPATERLLALLDFSPAAGTFTRRKNGRAVGVVRPSGHVFLFIDGGYYGAHRVAYFLTHGVDPGTLMVDHINRNPSDNRPENLRLATLQQNTQNLRGARRDSSTGVRGVRWRKRDNRWYAEITVGGRKKYLGSFANLQSAADAAQAARQEIFGVFAGQL